MGKKLTEEEIFLRVHKAHEEEYDFDQEWEINGFDKYYYESLKNAFNYDIADLIKGELTEYNWVSPDDDWQLTLTGLLLGFPIESTASILNDN